MTWKDYPIFQREDKSFIIVINESPYHVPNEGEWEELYKEVDIFYNENESSRSTYELQYSDLHPEPEIVEPELTPEEQKQLRQKRYTVLIQSILDKEAYKLGYTGINESISGACNSVCTYIDTGISKFDSEGKAFRIWRSQVWNKAYEILALVKNGDMEIPSEEELLEMLPKLEIIYE